MGELQEGDTAMGIVGLTDCCRMVGVMSTQP